MSTVVNIICLLVKTSGNENRKDVSHTLAPYMHFSFIQMMFRPSGLLQDHIDCEEGLRADLKEGQRVIIIAFIIWGQSVELFPTLNT